jgi:hypothetical protein
MLLSTTSLLPASRVHTTAVKPIVAMASYAQQGEWFCAYIQHARANGTRSSSAHAIPLLVWLLATQCTGHDVHQFPISCATHVLSCAPVIGRSILT